MSCNIGQNIGLMLAGWVIGIVVFACFFMLCFYMCTVCQKYSLSDARRYMNVWFFYVPIIVGLVVGLTIELIVGGLVCFETTRAIGFGCLISSQSLNLCYNVGYNVLNCFFRKKDVEPNDEEKKESTQEEKKEPEPA